jgi:hypothetical protein
MPLVLAENERTIGGLYDSWQDTTGREYHFPNVYRRKVEAGDWFVYYRGVRTLTGRRPNPEYFGMGRITDVWRDAAIPETAPKRGWRWFCSISDYVPFPEPVSWKRNGELFEQIKQNRFRDGVRSISQETYEAILEGAGLLETLQAGEVPTFTRGNAGILPATAPGAWSASDVGEPEPARRVFSTSYRVLRDTPLARRLKQLHEHACQICGTAISFPDGQKYSEAHHIQPLGRPHNGTDRASNILVLCPTHHVLCDYGAIRLDLRELRQHPDHVIRPEFVRYHNRVVSRTVESVVSLGCALLIRRQG